MKKIEIDFEEIENKLKEKFTSEEIKEIAFSFSSDSGNITKIIDVICNDICMEEIKDFFIEKKAAEITVDINTAVEYKKSEDYCSEYFTDYQNSDVQINQNFNSVESEKIKNIVIKLIDRFYEKDFIDCMEFEYEENGSPLYTINHDICFSIGNLGEHEISLLEESTQLLNSSILSEQIKLEISATISDNNEFAYVIASYDLLTYSISFDKFFNAIFNAIIDVIDIEDNLIEIALLLELYKFIDSRVFEKNTRNRIDIIRKNLENNSNIIGFYSDKKEKNNSTIFVGINEIFSYDSKGIPFITSYCPIGQHSSLSIDYLMEDCTEITKKEYIEISGSLHTPEEYLK